jgi:hypothetical protein
MFLFSMLHGQKPSYRTPLHCCNCCSAPHLQQSEGEGETYRRVGVSAGRRGGETYRRMGVSAGRRGGETKRRVGGSAYGRNETAYRRVGTRGAVGLRSRATGVARLETSLLLITPPQPFILRSLLFACSSSITCNAGRAGAQPYRATRADTPIRRPAVSFLPHADPPTRPYADTFLPLADPPTRRFVSPHTPTRRYADTPFRFSRLPLAHAGGISTGACRNLRIYAHKTWEKTRILFSSYSNPIFRWRVFSC